MNSDPIIEPLSLYKSLADDTRLRCILLIHRESELCVCELTQALGEIQPKVSRHLAQLRKTGLLTDRRQGQWVFYEINPQLPDWVFNVIEQTSHNSIEFLTENLTNLARMGDRPQRLASCN